MIYIKLEENRDKFMERYKNIPKSMKNLFFKVKCRKGKFQMQKLDYLDYIVVPEVNEKLFKKLKVLIK